NAVKIILLVIAVLLLIVSLMLVANTIRLSIYARRREIELMRLVGATNWFIRWPFVFEGLIVGLFGAALAVGILWVGKLTIIDPLSQTFVLIDNFSTIGFVPLVATLMAAAVVVSALGSGVTLRRFLRVWAGASSRAFWPASCRQWPWRRWSPLSSASSRRATSPRR